jgi:plasmid stability protein
VKTTIELPDELFRALKVRAASEGRLLKDVMTEVVRRGLAAPEPSGGGARARRVQLPLVECAHPASPEQEITPERAAGILLDAEAAAATGRHGPV